MKTYKMTHVQKIRQGREFKLAVRGLAPVKSTRKGSGR